MKPEIPNIEPDIPNNAVSIYDQGDAMDDFPVLRAFQQYVDSEQAKSRKRLLSMGIFFGVLIIAIIAVFMVLLVTVSERNQALNDKMLEFVMKEHDRDREKAQPPAAPVVVQPPQDNSAILALTSKLDEMQKRLTDSQAATEKALREKSAAEAAAIEAAKSKAPSPQELEIQKLKKMLEDQRAQTKELAEAEKKRKKEEELEAYRRKHYPELYAPKPTLRKNVRRAVEIDDEDDDLDLDLNFEDEDDEEVVVRPKRKVQPKRESSPKSEVRANGDAKQKSSAKSPSKNASNILYDLKDDNAINYFNDEEQVVEEKRMSDDWEIPEE